MNMGPWSISDMWASVGVNRISALQLAIDSELMRWLAWRRKHEQRRCWSLGVKDTVYQEYRRALEQSSCKDSGAVRKKWLEGSWDASDAAYQDDVRRG